MFGTNFTNLRLGTTEEGHALVGGSDVYSNGEMTISNNVYFQGSVFLEGNGRDGSTDADRWSRQTSRWINVYQHGSPVAGAFEVQVRDAYHNRRMVNYPVVAGNNVPESQIAYYVLSEAVSRYFNLQEEVVAAGAGENWFLNEAEDTLWLRVPTAIYIDPENGNDHNDGMHPEQAVATLRAAFNRMRSLSAKVLYVMNPIPIDTNVVIRAQNYTDASGSVALAGSVVHLDIRRYVKPDEGAHNYNDLGQKVWYLKESFTSGPLFRVEDLGELVIEGNVTIDGHSQPLMGENVPPDQKVSNGVAVTAPLVAVQQGGRLELRICGEGHRPELIHNNNTAALSGGEARMEGGAIYNKGTVVMNGGSLKGNEAAPVAGRDSAGSQQNVGSADGIYQAGDLVVSAYPQGLAGQDIYLASNYTTNASGGAVSFTADHFITMDMRIEDEKAGDAKLTYEVDMDNASAGRQVVSYPGDSEVDAEYASYKLGVTVPAELFLVESENNSSVLELQDWQYLDVSVPEEIFLAVHEYHNRDAGAPYGAGAYTKVARADVDGAGYGTPEYTITNNGLHEVRVTVTGLIQKDWQGSDANAESIQLAASTSELAGADPLLYLALEKSGESAGAGNRFAGFAGAVLNKSTGLNAELGTLKPAEHGSFAFAGAANAAFMDRWMDASFPSGSLETAAARIAHMRTEDAAGSTALNHAAGQFKLTYRIELAAPRR